jgi:hypothetical protein
MNSPRLAIQGHVDSSAKGANVKILQIFSPKKMEDKIGMQPFMQKCIVNNKKIANGFAVN